MKRYLVVFHSHTEGPADVHFVDVQAETELRAIATAKRECAPLHPWATVKALAWPKKCKGIEEAMEKLTGTWS